MDNGASESPRAQRRETDKWRCGGCGHIHVHPRPPFKCPGCQAGKSAFYEFKTGRAEKDAPSGGAAEREMR